MRATRALAVAALAVAALAASTASCSLDLDESRIGAGLDATAPGPDGAAAATDAAADGASGECTTDDGCRPANACLEGTCDVARKRCVYDVCPTDRCKASACDPGPKTCGAPVDYKMKVTEIALRAPVISGRAIAAVYPWLFVATTSGLSVLDISNPAKDEVREVPVFGLGFVPAQLVASGPRVWLRAAVSGPGPSALPLAVIDVPGDPFVEHLTARTVVAAYDRPAAEGLSIFPRPGDSVLLAGGAAAKSPSVFVEAPLAEPLDLKSSPIALPNEPDVGAFATSGDRLLAGSLVDGAQSFHLVGGAGGPTPSPGSSSPIPGRTSSAQRFGQSEDGAIFWAAGVHAGAGAEARTRASRGFFLVGGEAQGLVVDAAIDIEELEAGIAVDAAVVGPVAMPDAKTAIVAIRPTMKPMESALQVVTREPLAAPPERRVPLAIPLAGLLGAASTRGISYFAGNLAGPPAAGVVFVIAAGCDP